LDPCVYDVFDSESALELNPEVVTLIPGTPCIMLWFTMGNSRIPHNILCYRQDVT